MFYVPYTYTPQLPPQEHFWSWSSTIHFPSTLHIRISLLVIWSKACSPILNMLKNFVYPMTIDEIQQIQKLIFTVNFPLSFYASVVKTEWTGCLLHYISDTGSQRDFPIYILFYEMDWWESYDMIEMWWRCVSMHQYQQYSRHHMGP